jgi:flagellin-like hook-associated protein FlgL
MRELSVQSMNGSLQSADRSNLDTEFQALNSEIDRIAQSTSFNGTSLLTGSAQVNFQVGTGTQSTDQIQGTFGDMGSAALKIDTAKVGTDTDAKTAIDSSNVRCHDQSFASDRQQHPIHANEPVGCKQPNQRRRRGFGNRCALT